MPRRGEACRYGAGMSAIEGVGEILDSEAWDVVPGSTGEWAFCSGGDQRIRGRAGYQCEPAPWRA